MSIIEQSAVVSYAIGAAAALWLLPRRFVPFSFLAAIVLCVVALRGDGLPILGVMFGSDRTPPLLELLRNIPLTSTVVPFFQGILAALMVSAPLLAYRLFARWISSLIQPADTRRFEFVLLVSFFAILFDSDYPARSIVALATFDSSITGLLTEARLMPMIASSFSVAASFLLPFAALALCYGGTMFFVARFLHRRLVPAQAALGLQLALLFLLIFTSYLLEGTLRSTSVPLSERFSGSSYRLVQGAHV